MLLQGVKFQNKSYHNETSKIILNDNVFSKQKHKESL